jgi:hypothetical protein
MNVMTGLTACAVNEKLSYECLNTEKDIESCESQQSLARSNRYLTGCRSTLGGGCIRGANATGSIGQDCTTLVSTFVPMAPIGSGIHPLAFPYSPTSERSPVSLDSVKSNLVRLDSNSTKKALTALTRTRHSESNKSTGSESEPQRSVSSNNIEEILASFPFPFFPFMNLGPQTIGSFYD